MVATAAVFAPDVERPENLGVEFWQNSGAIYNLPLMDDNGNFLVQQTKFYVASTSLQPTHVADGTGKPCIHVHFKDEYQNIQHANNYWDSILDAPYLTTRLGNATTKRNGVAMTLEEIASNGTYGFWIDSNGRSMEQALAAARGTPPMMKGGSKPSDKFGGKGPVKGLPKKASVHHGPAQKAKIKVGVSGTYQGDDRAFDPKIAKSSGRASGK